MILETVQERSVLTALTLANRAPSVHNSQPWRWRFGRGSLHLYADLRRWLPVIDPDGRDVLLSCGAVLHHVTVALAATEIRATVHRLPNPDEPDHLAAVELTPGTCTATELALAGAISRRRTDRRRFDNWPVPVEHLRLCTAAAAGHGAVLRAITEAGQRTMLAAAIDYAAAEQDADDRYAGEIAVWSGRYVAPDGVPAANVPRAGDDAATLPMRRWAEGRLAQPPTPEDEAVIMALGTSSDDRLSQLRAGEAASAVLLRATELGLGSSVLSQPLEVPATRRLVRDQVLGGTLSPQLVLRIGWPPAGEPEIPASPRRPVTDTVERLPR